VTKQELRKAIRVRLAALQPEAAAEKSAAICSSEAHTAEWSAAQTIGFFSPLALEPNIDLLWAVLGDRAVCYPRIAGDSLVFIRVPSREALLESSRWNLLEPPHRDEHVVPVDEVDLFFVPGIAFAPAGHRMGRGKGYYDRLLAHPAFRSPAFGICFAEQLVAHLPMEDHDRPVTRVFSA